MKPVVNHSAIVPMVGGRGALCRIACDTRMPPPHPAQLDPRCAALLESGLYVAGQQAIAAAHALHLPRAGWTRPASASLQVLNPGDIAGLAPENASSAELGLALAWLMQQAGSTISTVMATGKLAPEMDASVPILPIHHLGEKLRLMAEYFERPGSSSPPSHLFLPTRDPDGRLTAEKHAEALQRLHRLGITAYPVHALRDAANRLGLRRLAPSPRERQLQFGMGALLLLAMTGACGLWLIQRPLTVTFSPVASVQGDVLSTPARAISETDGLALMPPCPTRGTLPVHPIGEQLAIRLDLPASHLPLQLLVVSVSGVSGVKVLPLPADSKATPGSIAFSLSVQPPEEDNLIMVLARRLLPYNAARLQQDLQTLLQPLKPPERLSAARNWLASQATGYATYHFRSVAAGACS